MAQCSNWYGCEKYLFNKIPSWGEKLTHWLDYLSKWPQPQLFLWWSCLWLYLPSFADNCLQVSGQCCLLRISISLLAGCQAGRSIGPGDINCPLSMSRSTLIECWRSGMTDTSPTIWLSTPPIWSSLLVHINFFDNQSNISELLIESSICSRQKQTT